jgi:hypothetical protein
MNKINVTKTLLSHEILHNEGLAWKTHHPP